MFNKNSLMRFFVVASVLALTVFAVRGVFTVYADNDSSIEDLINGKSQFKFDVFPPGIEKNFDIRQPSLNVNPQGRALIIAGEVTESNWPYLKVKIWGLVLNIHAVQDVRIIGGTAQTSNSTATGTPATIIPTVVVGDKVDILGDMDKDTGLINAKTFKDRSQGSKDIENLNQRIQDLLKQIEELRAKIKALSKGL